MILHDEKILLLHVKEGSHESYRRLYNLWVSRLYAFVYHYVKSEEVADDIVQETFIRIWVNRETLNLEYSFKSYLFTIAYHFLLKELRRQLNNPLMEEYVSFLDGCSTSDDEASHPLEYDEFCQQLAEAKKLLQPRQREIFELNKENNLSVSEIAERLSISEQVVRNQLSGALKILRKALHPYPGLFLAFLLNF